MNWLVVGIGDVTLKRVLPGLAAEARSTVYGVVTRDAAKGRRHAPRAWADLAAALADPAIDAVYIATPVFLHAPQAIAALQAGKHVLCEKPAALNHAEARAMVEAARTAGRRLGIAYFRRQYPKLLRARALLAAGAIGQPVAAFASCSEWFHDQDGTRSWLLDPARAGSGPLYDIGSHRIDALNFLFGAPGRVAAQFSNGVHASAVEDSATVMIEYLGGLRAVVDARWNTRVGLDDFRVIGTTGEMDLSPLSGPPLRHPGGEEMLPCADNRHAPCIRDFVTAILAGTPFAAEGADCLATAQVLDDALKTSGRP